MPSLNFDLIREAIEARQQIHAFYNGYHREMCPHVVGYKGGREKALFYQFAGGSSTGIIRPTDHQSGPRDNWRCIFVTELEDLSVVPGLWYTARNHSRPQTCIDEIRARVRPD